MLQRIYSTGILKMHMLDTLGKHLIFAFMAIFTFITTRLMNRMEEELNCDKCDEMFIKKSQIVKHVEVRHVYRHCIYMWQNGGGDILGEAF